MSDTIEPIGEVNSPRDDLLTSCRDWFAKECPGDELETGVFLGRQGQVARIDARSRRPEGRTEIDVAGSRLWWDGRCVRVPPRVLSVLAILWPLPKSLKLADFLRRAYPGESVEIQSVRAMLSRVNAHLAEVRCPHDVRLVKDFVRWGC